MCIDIYIVIYLYGRSFIVNEYGSKRKRKKRKRGLQVVHYISAGGLLHDVLLHDTYYERSYFSLFNDIIDILIGREL